MKRMRQYHSDEDRGYNRKLNILSDHAQSWGWPIGVCIWLVIGLIRGISLFPVSVLRFKAGRSVYGILSIGFCYITMVYFTMADLRVEPLNEEFRVFNNALDQKLAWVYELGNTAGHFLSFIKPAWQGLNSPALMWEYNPLLASISWFIMILAMFHLASEHVLTDKPQISSRGKSYLSMLIKRHPEAIDAHGLLQRFLEPGLFCGFGFLLYRLGMTEHIHENWISTGALMCFSGATLFVAEIGAFNVGRRNR